MREASRELDAEIAEKVMGWPHDEAENCLYCLMGSIAACNEVTRDLPDYSTDIAAAWQVVDKLKATQGFALSYRGIENTPVSWGADFCNSGEVLAATAPLAICLAALKAITEETT